MELLSGKQVAKRVTTPISERYQVHGVSVELTVKNVFAMGMNGAVDFGGGEYVTSARAPVAPFRKHAEDRYQWWELVRGGYTVVFNEKLKLDEDEVGILEPHERLLRVGATHPTLFLRGPHENLETLLMVGTPKVRVKQNARISRLLVFRLIRAPHVVPVLTAKPKKAAAKKASVKRKGKK